MGGITPVPALSRILLHTRGLGVVNGTKGLCTKAAPHLPPPIVVDCAAKHVQHANGAAGDAAASACNCACACLTACLAVAGQLACRAGTDTGHDTCT